MPFSAAGGGADASLSAPPRLLIADDDPVVQSALSVQLHRDFKIVGGARDAEQAITMAESLQPDVVIVDVQMPGGGGLRAAREIHQRAPRTAIVALSSDESDSVVRAILEAGAMTYVRKGRPAQELIEILRSSIAAHATLIST